MKPKKTPWGISPSDVGMGTWGSTRSGRRSGSLSKQPASFDEKSAELTLTHKPTNQSVTQTIATGNYTNKQFKLKKQELQKQLFFLLEEKVAKHLKIPGYVKKPKPA